MEESIVSVSVDYWKIEEAKIRYLLSNYRLSPETGVEPVNFEGACRRF